MMVVLDPHQKLNYICTNWGEDMYLEVLQHSKSIVSVGFML
jgi:hypothetical protein